MMDASARPFADVLFAEDFDVAPEPDPDTYAGAPGTEPAPAADPQQDIAEAVEYARAAWAQADTHLVASALATIATTIQEAASQASTIAEEYAADTAKTILAMVAAYLPNRCRDHGPAEVEALMRRLLPRIAQQSRLVVRVNPALLSPLQAQLATLDDDAAANVVLTGVPALTPGSAHVKWANGSLQRDTEAIRMTIEAVLSELGLHEPRPIEPPSRQEWTAGANPSPAATPHRSLAYATD